jgi:MoxR-like ATPase
METAPATAAPATAPELGFEEARELLGRIVANVETVVYGKRDVVELVLLCMVARGHVLIEDVPGTGKTSLVAALATSVSCDFSRIQFTPDVMPSDITGFSVFNQKTREFEFRPGSVMANVVLADEINRASAKTQSALLEAMEERQVTVDGATHRLAEPFMVLATQNPIEHFGTYPLPEAQVDRFMVKTSVGYPSFEQEERIIVEGRGAKRALGPMATRDELVALADAAERVHIGPAVRRYLVQVVTATRNHPDVQVGASPRATIALADLARAYALYRGRGYVIPDDVKDLAAHVLGHRMALAYAATVEGRTPGAVVADILASIAVPVDDEAR